MRQARLLPGRPAKDLLVVVARLVPAWSLPGGYFRREGDAVDPLALALDDLKNIDRREGAASIFRFETLLLPR